MTHGFTSIGRFLRGFRRGEDGGPTIEFCIMFIPFMILTISAFELGLLTTRHVMLERGLDMAIREVRLNTGSIIDEDDLKVMVCNAAGLIPVCTDRLRLEMVTVDLRTTNGVGAGKVDPVPECIDSSDPFARDIEFNNGLPNQMMFVRACARAAPMFPDYGLGWFLSRMADDDSDRYYRLVATSAFVMEPL
ncbi:pilus assembly protein [Octadecabacter sp. 1_MG-2023]|uniref:TadE/TadG family type IV pilus assembly protein n=1 Tax=unclassified Octadecabacter TaxID=196158 RepID=UPI001C08D23D|nr:MULTISPECIES: pilus assembly protein [unclassified Octadecabacter]MBU2993933.1 pilus assembly protein [Octadecabacter sp. B2R22]MDO6735221.1 pilus assembly protein [Octadecabacter sp. 1_MG-2023]